MFRRDVFREALKDVQGLLGQEAEPGLLPLMRQAFAHGGVLAVARGPDRRILAFGGVPVRGVFELASLTKPFTAALAQALVRAGVVDWDTPLRSPNGSLHNGPLRRLPPHFTPFALATHTAGVPPHPARAVITTITHFSDPYSPMSALQVLDSARRWSRPTTPPRFGYSNLGVGVLALALAHLAGEDLSAQGYGRALQQHVLQPLGLSAVTLTPAPASVVTPRGLLGGHDTTGFGPLAGAGGLFSTADDLLTFGLAHLSTQAGRHWTRGISPAGLPLPRTAVAPGWFHSAGRHGPVIWHDGVARGTRTALGFHPGSGGVIVILARGGVPLLGQRSAVPLLLLRLLGAQVTRSGHPLAQRPQAPPPDN